MNLYTTKKKVLVLMISGCLSFKSIGSGFPVLDIAGLVQAVSQYTMLIQEYDQILKQTGLNTDQLLTAIDQYSRQADFGTRDDMNTLATDALSYVPQDLSYSYNLASSANNESKEREFYRNLNVQSRADIDHVDKQRLSLGSQSELATLQLLVEQNQILIDQIATSNEMKLASMGSSNMANQSAQIELRSKLKRLERMKKAKEQGIIIDERPLR
jgi:hypothetical protein